ncbi:hypothetical protein OE88DRAFT_1656202 [Heliocybe sulcata]|uniref:HNH nuclease domain-containing protein n=1 Tax=Heliocybe sulcata TaxID=5364 RepID=A0A5C3N9B7_9AGAM|nr:hypothetical protein OE88DRAFT_1656202 [Heliocybe sulcata]
MPEPLPPLSEIEHKFATLPNAISAYNTCLHSEKTVSSQQDLISARVLGYLLLHAPSDEALAEVAITIHSCDQDTVRLCALGEAFVHCFIRACEYIVSRQGVLDRSHHQLGNSERGLPRVLKTPVAHLLTGTDPCGRLPLMRRPKIIRLRRHKPLSAIVIDALFREGSTCWPRKHSVLRVMSSPSLAAPPVATQCAHIVPASTYLDVATEKSDQDPTKKDYAASVLAVLKRFGYNVDKLNGANVHSLSNVMTLQWDVHHFFDTLNLWLEATDAPNCYRIRGTDSDLIPPTELVTFTTPDPEHLPLPSAELLALHAACAKVAHLSGAAEYLDDLDRDLEASTVLASDGGSSEVLHYAITRLAREGVDVGA